MWDNLFIQFSPKFLKLFFSFVCETFNLEGADFTHRDGARGERERRELERKTGEKVRGVREEEKG